ncbi:2-oxo-tetronate isomerase [Paracoccus sp. J55]|uniref:2-oxo-tetronate isomerase n=1 Tax=Paracoccus sp. J55 TaxID=935849 RepID=UPI00048F721A|nr:2-oxo-tetronate isomerase [Paracoccus sp. J55]
MPRFAANLTMMFGELPFLDRFAAAADAGFRAVEFLFPYDHPAETIRKAADSAGLRIVLFNLPPGDWAAGERGIAAFPERADEFTRALALGLDYARVLSVPRLHLMAGIAPSQSAPHRNRYRDAIAEAAESAGPSGIDILLEPLNRRDMPGYLLSDFAMAEYLIDSLGLPNVKLQFDIYHRQIMHGDVTEALRTLLPIIGHVQTASVPGRNEPGTGELDDTRIFGVLDRIGYQGHVGCEYRPLSTTGEGLGWFVPWRE